MKDKSAVGEHRQEKACVCRIVPKSKLFLRPTHQHNAKGQSEYKCWLCGRLAYESA
jgi:hypothetical protein